MVVEVVGGVTTPEEGRELVSRATEIVSLGPIYSIRRAFYFNLTNDGVMTLDKSREPVSRAAELLSLSPSYSIRRAFYFDLTKKGWYQCYPKR